MYVTKDSYFLLDDSYQLSMDQGKMTLHVIKWLKIDIL